MWYLLTPPKGNGASDGTRTRTITRPKRACLPVPAHRVSLCRSAACSFLSDKNYLYQQNPVLSPKYFNFFQVNFTDAKRGRAVKRPQTASGSRSRSAIIEINSLLLSLLLLTPGSSRSSFAAFRCRRGPTPLRSRGGWRSRRATRSYGTSSRWTDTAPW